MQPKIVIEKRRVPEGNASVAEYSAKVVHATTDADGNVLTQKVSFEVIVRYPVNGQTAQITSARDIIRDIVASDDFAASAVSQNWL